MEARQGLRGEIDAEAVEADVLDAAGRDGLTVGSDDGDVRGRECGRVDRLAEPDVNRTDRPRDVARRGVLRDARRDGVDDEREGVDVFERFARNTIGVLIEEET